MDGHDGQPRAPLVVITGAAGGLGAATCTHFLARGWRVVAVDLAAPSDRPGLTGVACDVTDAASVEAMAQRVVEVSGGRIDALVTFAGVLGVGPLAETDPGRIARVLDVNVMGTVRTVHALFDQLRAASDADGTGRVVLLGSETGPQHAMPMNGPYAMSKHAVEAYADALRRELMFLDMEVVLVQPGPFRTGMTASIREGFARACPPGSPFAAMAAVMGEKAAGEDAKASDPAVLAAAVYRATTTSRPRHRYAVRWDLGRRVLDRLPVPLVDSLLVAGLGGEIARRGGAGSISGQRSPDLAGVPSQHP